MTVFDTRSITIREVWSLLDRTRFAISRLRELELAKNGMTIEQSSILYILTNLGGTSTARELENITMRQHHSISVLINGMVKMGWVCKTRNPDQKRYTIGLTHEGRVLYQKTTIASLEETIGFMSEIDRQKLTALLNCLLVRARSCLGLSLDSPTKIMKETGVKDQGLPVHELWTLMDRTRFAISRLRELELARFDLTIEQTSILDYITRNGGSTTAKDLEDVTMRRQNSVSSLINGMVRMGLVTKVRNADEKRFSIVITKAGQTLFRKVTIVSLENNFSALSADERLQLTGYLESLLERSRFLLGIPHQPPFLQFLADGNPDSLN